ncbi:unnamed protein product [Heligmosomoides polygyrus]|uniref:DUF5641 domain-containing protein n=1 Tax=Heligmosomoides polygyrus TaxID=6339 RepID=A0A3P8BV91_HELPZ|nr:unnamed protein product [Heligmosomoides polygyrus]
MWPLSVWGNVTVKHLELKASIPAERKDNVLTTTSGRFLRSEQHKAQHFNTEDHAYDEVLTLATYYGPDRSSAEQKRSSRKDLAGGCVLLCESTTSARSPWSANSFALEELKASRRHRSEIVVESIAALKTMLRLALS